MGLNKPFVPFNKEYPGYESVFDLERDIAEWLNYESNLPSEFNGTLKVSITYEED